MACHPDSLLVVSDGVGVGSLLFGGGSHVLSVEGSGPSMRPFALLLAGLLVLGAVAGADARVWTDTQGRQIEAKFVRVHGGRAILQQGNKASP